ncbi:hypothetical protein CCHR01_05604 [Colletotrichum chrysophilum]|uniref:Uncharacterized protein n=1 Tax=Colletotrichum chrysophilum TaxID=1836956 RepID=A0AAD9ELC2_9PEZI|nr:hypothetical protein CCHR01_05604 [Colletotrichum chrysophilum]
MKKTLVQQGPVQVKSGRHSAIRARFVQYFALIWPSSPPCWRSCPRTQCRACPARGLTPKERERASERDKGLDTTCLLWSHPPAPTSQSILYQAYLCQGRPKAQAAGVWRASLAVVQGAVGTCCAGW